MSQQLAAECVSIHNVRSRCQLKPHIVIGSHNHGLCRQFSWSDMRAILVVDCVEVMLIRCHSAVMVPSMMVVESLFVVPYLAGVSVSTWQTCCEKPTHSRTWKWPYLQWSPVWRLWRVRPFSSHTGALLAHWCTYDLDAGIKNEKASPQAQFFVHVSIHELLSVYSTLQDTTIWTEILLVVCQLSLFFNSFAPQGYHGPNFIWCCTVCTPRNFG